MTKAELEKKHLSDLHLLAAEAGVEKYRMLSKSELIDRLAGENGDSGSSAARPAATEAESRDEERERPARRRRRRRTGSPAVSDEIELGEKEERKPTPERESTPEPASQPEQEAEAPRPRRRRRRRFGRRKQGVTLQTLLLPPEAGRQALVFAETREGCTALLRGVAADLSADAKGPDPVALLIDPSPEELADWKRDAPQAEIVSAGQPRHANDALAQAAARAGKGEDVILLVDSLTRLGEATGDAEAAKEFFDAGRAQGTSGGGSLTVVAALERPNGD
jgi:transcription termination factor Rho